VYWPLEFLLKKKPMSY